MTPLATQRHAFGSAESTTECVEQVPSPTVPSRLIPGDSDESGAHAMKVFTRVGVRSVVVVAADVVVVVLTLLAPEMKGGITRTSTTASKIVAAADPSKVPLRRECGRRGK